MYSAFRKVRTSCWDKSARTIGVKRRVVKLSLVTEAHGKRLVFVAFSRPCGSELPVLKACNTAVLMHSLYSFQYMITYLLNFVSAFCILCPNFVNLHNFFTMPSMLRKCDDCTGKFGPEYFRNSPICRLCVNRKRLQEVAVVMQEMYHDLEKKFDTLQEFVAANVGITPPSLVERPPTATVPTHNDSSSASEDDSLSASQNEWIQPVTNGAKPTRSTKQLLARTTFNSFQVLGETMEDESETRLVEDSLVRGQLVEFCGPSSNSRRKCFCYSGVRLDDITAPCEDATSEADHNTLFIIHACTNDVKTTRSEEMLEKYRPMTKQYKRKIDGNNITVSGPNFTTTSISTRSMVST